MNQSAYWLAQVNSKTQVITLLWETLSFDVDVLWNLQGSDEVIFEIDDWTDFKISGQHFQQRALTTSLFPWYCGYWVNDNDKYQIRHFMPNFAPDRQIATQVLMINMNYYGNTMTSTLSGLVTLSRSDVIKLGRLAEQY